MLALKNTVVVIGFLTTATVAIAQKPKPAVARTATVQKFKPPKLKSSLGTRSDSVGISVDEAVAIITLPINITDDKKSAYTISSYQCMYKRKGVTENEENGKVSPTTSVVANLFKTTPLPEIWKKVITEELKTGEEILFFDIVVKDALGRLMFAPNIKLVIK
jgi:hypothetical protein